MPDSIILKENLDKVRDNINEACLRSGRDAESVTLVCVTKTVDAATVEALYGLGERNFGENRAQVGVPKRESLAASMPEARWHFIGHMQRNKVRQILPGFTTLHSVDSPRLMQEVAKIATREACTADVFIEVKTSEEDAKYGAEEVSEIAAIISAAEESKHVNLCGLMTMAPYVEAEETRPYFVSLREKREQLEKEFGISLPELSMGMSNDYTVAIEEGATLVRVGSALYETE